MNVKNFVRRLKEAWQLIRDAAKDWSNDKAPRLGAALAYYTVFAIAPVLLVAMSVAALALGQEAAQGHILDELRSMFGDDTAKMIQEALAKSSERKSGVIGTVVGVGTLLVGATAVMIELEAALDAVWKVVPRPGRGIKGLHPRAVAVAGPGAQPRLLADGVAGDQRRPGGDGRSAGKLELPRGGRSLATSSTTRCRWA